MSLQQKVIDVIFASDGRGPQVERTAVGFKYYVCVFLRAVLATNVTPTESDTRNICIRRQMTLGGEHCGRIQILRMSIFESGARI